MKIATLLIPTYMPTAYASATPSPYLSSVVDRFERELVALTPLVIRQGFSIRISPDVNGRFAHQQPVTRYELMTDPAKTTLGDACALALKTFNLESVTVIYDGDAEPINIGAVEELQNGLHIWNTED